MATALGVQRELPALPSLSLGAAELSPLEVAEIYASIANGGIHIEPRALRKIIDADGRVIEVRPPQVAQAASQQAAYMVTHMLRSVLDSGTGRGVRELGFSHALRPAKRGPAMTAGMPGSPGSPTIS